jgi:hypothetical protein
MGYAYRESCVGVFVDFSAPLTQNTGMFMCALLLQAIACSTMRGSMTWVNRIQMSSAKVLLSASSVGIAQSALSLLTGSAIA